MKHPYQTSLSIKVRDYECDMQGIVNNAVYQNYLEHGRHEYLIERGLDFAQITQAGVHLVVVRAELDYKKPLKTGFRFKVISHLERVSRLKFAFKQKILSPDEKQVYLEAVIFCVSLNKDGRPSSFKDLEALL